MENTRLNNNKTCRSFDFYVLLFFLVSFLGWIWEGAIYLVKMRSFVNRGVYLGPYLPIYGAGGLMLWFLLHRLSRRPALTFLLSALVCSALEYAVSFCLEKMWGLRWWDYSGWFMNLNGRICLVSAVFFGLGGMALNCFLMPYYMRIYHRLSRGWRIALCILFLTVFILDATYCAVRPHMGDNVSYGKLTQVFVPQAAGGTPDRDGAFSGYFWAVPYYASAPDGAIMLTQDDVSTGFILRRH